MTVILIKSELAFFLPCASFDDERKGLGITRPAGLMGDGLRRRFGGDVDTG